MFSLEEVKESDVPEKAKEKIKNNQGIVISLMYYICVYVFRSKIYPRKKVMPLFKHVVFVRKYLHTSSQIC